MIEKILVGFIIALMSAAMTMIYISGNIKRTCRDGGVITIDQKEYVCGPLKPLQKTTEELRA